MQRYSIIGDLIRAGFGGVIPVNNVTQKQNLNLFLDFVFHLQGGESGKCIIPTEQHPFLRRLLEALQAFVVFKADMNKILAGQFIF